MIAERIPFKRVYLTGFLGETAVHTALQEATHPPLPEEFQMLRDTVGQKFLYELGQVHAPIYVVNKVFAVPVKDFRGNVPLWNPKYLMSYFVSAFDKKLVVMSTWKAIHPSRVKIAKAVQIDFLQISDMLSLKSSRHLYPLRQRLDNPGFTGMHSEGAHFLRKMHRLIDSISDDCTVFMVPADEQRERLQQRAFRDRPNVVVQEYSSSSMRKR